MFVVLEERADALLVIDTSNRLANRSGDGNDVKLAHIHRIGAEGNRVGHNDLIKGRLGNTLEGGARKYGMRNRGMYRDGPIFH